MTIASEMEFPELLAGSGTPDVWVRCGAVPAHLSSAPPTGLFFEADADSFLLRVEGVARYWVRAGRDIVVDVAADALDVQVRTFFLGAVLTAVLHQRGVLVLHASGVVGARGAVLFAGSSGGGKSTLLAALVGRGYEPFGDDVAVVTQEATNQLLVHPGVPQVRLWADAATRLGHRVEESSRILPSIDKYALPLKAFGGCAPRPLTGLYVLSVGDGDELQFEPIEGSQCFTAIREYTRNLQIMEDLQMQRPHFHLAAAVASRIPVVRISRPRGRDSLDELVDRVESTLA